ncbi:MAG: hypothetical protein IBJ11_10195 [Phycisphaerales bacterium]|nr:hypothetical protein [Phycisphaerales bacterium]
MNTWMAAVAVVSGLIAGAPASAQTVLFSQGPTPTGSLRASISEQGTNGFYKRLNADNFTLVSGGTVSQVKFQGASENFSGPPNGLSNVTSFTITLYTGSGGLPGSAIYSETVGNNATDLPRVDTGRRTLANANVFEFTRTLTTPQTLAAGTYWISVGVTVASGNADSWAWAIGAAADGVSARKNPVDTGAWGSISGNDYIFTLVQLPPPAPGSFNLTYPAFDEAGVLVQPYTLFRWQAASNASSYTLTVSPNADLSSPVVNQSGLAATSAVLPANALAFGTRYYWRVTAVNGAGSTVATPGVSDFVTQNAYAGLVYGQSLPATLANNGGTISEAGTNGFYNRLNGDNFAISGVQSGTISQVVFYGGSENFAGPPDGLSNISSFQLTIYQRTGTDPNLPGVVIAQESFAPAQALPKPTGRTFVQFQGQQGPGVEYRFLRTLATPVVIQPDTQYWISIGVNVLDSNQDSWLWSKSVDVDGYRARNLLTGPAGWEVVSGSGDQAFELRGSTVPLPQAPGPFALLTPADGSTGVALTPTLDWADATNASAYTVTVRDSGNGVVWSSVTLTSQATVPGGVLANGQAYTWGVTAANGNGTTPSTPASFAFTTLGGAVAPGPFNLTSPTAGQLIALLPVPASLAPTVTWTASAGTPTPTYSVAVATDPAFSNIVASASGLAGLSWQVSPALAFGTRYYARVRANNSAGTASSSPASVLFGVKCQADVDNNGSVGANDLSLLLTAFGGGAGGPSDLDGAGGVGANDLSLLLTSFGACSVTLP